MRISVVVYKKKYNFVVGEAVVAVDGVSGA
jgi:hypothetical protein